MATYILEAFQEINCPLKLLFTTKAIWLNNPTQLLFMENGGSSSAQITQLVNLF